MIKQWLEWLNYLVAGIAVLFLVLGLFFLFIRPSTIFVSNTPPPKTALPKRAFAMSKESYDAIGEPVFSLQFAPMSMQLPELKKYLIYYGKNGRPDAVAEKPLLHFAFTGNKTISSVVPGERLYILYDRKLNPPQYVFSPGNAESSLWIEANAEGSEAQVKVTMKGDHGETIRDPEANANFNLPEKEYVRFGGTPWEIGKNRVDATLLARQKARWYGPDLFLEKHGGKEYVDRIGKQRIDFGEGDDVYSLYAGLNDTIVWSGDYWKVVKPGAESLGKPLLVVKKIEDRLMNLELWDPEGKGKITLNLLKSSEPQAPSNIQQNFKFVGARTRTQFVFEIDGERMLLSPHDWLLSTKDGWVKLQTAEEIDNYVDRKTTGALFVFDGVEKKEDHMSLIGTLFNPSRTDMQPVEIPLQQNGSTPPVAPGGKGNEKNAQSRKAGPLPNNLRDRMPPPPPPNEDDDNMDDEDDYE
jgi:hypothetical protein